MKMKLRIVKQALEVCFLSHSNPTSGRTDRSIEEGSIDLYRTFQGTIRPRRSICSFHDMSHGDVLPLAHDWHIQSSSIKSSDVNCGSYDINDPMKFGISSLLAIIAVATGAVADSPIGDPNYGILSPSGDEVALNTVCTLLYAMFTVS
jgi:hypothetical protein